MFNKWRWVFFVLSYIYGVLCVLSRIIDIWFIYGNFDLWIKLEFFILREVVFLSVLIFFVWEFVWLIFIFIDI